jgi:hypothetical protein
MVDDDLATVMEKDESVSETFYLYVWHAAALQHLRATPALIPGDPRTYQFLYFSESPLSCMNVVGI